MNPNSTTKLKGRIIRPIPIISSDDEQGKKKRGSSLLRNLIIDDNIHSKISQLARENPDEGRRKRVTSPIGYLHMSNIEEHYDTNERKSGKRHSYKRLNLRSRRLTRQKITEKELLVNNTDNNIQKNRSYTIRETSTLSEKHLELPLSIDKLNSINPLVHCITDQGASDLPENYIVSKIKIKYDPLKLLNFQRLLGSLNDNIELSSKSSNFIHDFKLNESEELINKLDNYSPMPFRGAIAKIKDASTIKSTPDINDRIFFRDLLAQSSAASYFNANVLLAYHKNSREADEEMKQKGHKKRIATKTSVISETHSKSIEYIYIRDYEIKTWYTTPYPEEYNRNNILYTCEYCLKYMNSRYVYYRHQLKCSEFHPPGNEIYRDGKLSVWEIDGRENVIYCQNLCLLAKLFLNSKTLYYDVEPFIFYVLTEKDDSNKGASRFHFVGYFSQEKLNSTDYNLSCILTLPIYQRKGYGHFLMDFSYLLSRRAFKWGTPEKPLSDLGLLSYRNFWKIKCSEILLQLKPVINSNSDIFSIKLENISNLTGMTPTDVILGLEQLKVLYINDQEFDNQRDPVTKKHYAIKIDSWKTIENVYNRWISKGYQELNPEKLIWKPMVFGPSCGIDAVGTMIETTTGVTRNTAGNGNSVDDFFKKSISMLANFMKDDISDPRSMESVAWDQIKRRVSITKNTEISNDKAWKLTYIEPDLENDSKVNLQKSTIELKNKDLIDSQNLQFNDNNEAFEEESENILDELENIEEDGEDKEYEIEEEPEENDEDDIDEEGLEIEIPKRLSSRKYIPDDSELEEEDDDDDVDNEDENEVDNDSNEDAGTDSEDEEDGTNKPTIKGERPRNLRTRNM